MRLLLDTHVVLWALGAPDRLPAAVRDALVDADNELGVSAATVWEIAIKRQLGKLDLPRTVAHWLLDAIEDLGATWLAITSGHAAAVETMPLHHRDPFDRLLVAQAAADGWTIVTCDAAFGAYGVPIYWS